MGPKASPARSARGRTGKQSPRVTFAEATQAEAARAVQTTRRAAAPHPAATKTAVAPAMRKDSGVVRARPKRQRQDSDNADDDDERSAALATRHKEPLGSGAQDTSSDGEDRSAASESDGRSDDLSDLASLTSGSSSGGSGSSDDDDANPFERAKRTGKRLQYKALRLRFLPPAFEEPQLFKFLGQFGARVLNCFCVRSRRTHQSKGIAYVQFDTEDVLPRVVEEFNGMALGGRAVRARAVTLHRPMPSKEKVTKRRELAYAYKTKGAPLKQHNVLASKSPVAILIKAARTEAANNAHLKALGIDFTTDYFTAQLAGVPADRITKKTKVLVDARASTEKPSKTPSPAKKAGRPAAAAPRSKASSSATAAKAAPVKKTPPAKKAVPVKKTPPVKKAAPAKKAVASVRATAATKARAPTPKRTRPFR